jgi:hypothetical protein
LLFGGAFIPNLPTTHTHTGHTHTHTHKPKSLRPLIFCLVHSAPHIENLRTQGAPPPGPPPCRGLVAALGLLCWACVNFIFSPRKVAQPGVGRSRVQGTSGALRQSAEDLQRCDNGRPALSAQLLGQPHEIGLQIRSIFLSKFFLYPLNSHTQRPLPAQVGGTHLRSRVVVRLA